MSKFVISEHINADQFKALQNVAINRGQAFLNNLQTSTFSSNKLSEISGGVSEGNLIDAGIYAGQSFLANKTSDIVSGVMQNEVVSSATQLAATGTGAVASAMSLANPENITEVTSIMTNLVQSVASDVTSEIMQSVGQYTGKHAIAILGLPGKIGKRTLEVFNENKNSVGDIISQINKKADENVESDAEKRSEEKTNQGINKIKNQMSKVVGEVNSELSKGLKELDKINKYVAEGPEYIENAINAKKDIILKKINDKLDTRWEETDKPFYDSLINDIADPKGKQLADIYNKRLLQTQAKLMTKLESQKKKAETKLKTALTKIKIKLKATNG